MWSYLTTRSFINPLPGYVENKLVLPKALRLDQMTLLRVSITLLAARRTRRSTHWLLCVAAVVQQGFFADLNTNSSPMTMSSPLDGAAGLIGNSGRNTADACDTNVSEMTSAHSCLPRLSVTFPRRVFGRRDRCAKGPRSDRA
jgi:hypothetical protein